MPPADWPFITACASLGAKIKAVEAAKNIASAETCPRSFAVAVRCSESRMNDDPSCQSLLLKLYVDPDLTLPRSGRGFQDQSWFPSIFAVPLIHSRYSASGVTPVSPPQPAEFPGPVDQLTTPIMTGFGAMRKTGAPESPLQAPSPAVSPLLAGSNRRICKVPGFPVATSVAARAVPPDLPSPPIAIPLPATTNASPGATAMPAGP